jgi:hypothetical protein
MAIDASTASVVGQTQEVEDEDQRGDGADQQSDGGKVARRPLERLAAVTRPRPGPAAV